MNRRLGQAAVAVVVLMGGAARGQAGAAPELVLDAGGHTASVNGLLFTPDGRALISVSDDKTIRVWDVATGEAVRVLHPPTGQGMRGRLNAAALSPDGTVVGVGGFGVTKGENAIYLINLAQGTMVRVMAGHQDVVMALAFSPDGRRLASGGADRAACLWNVADGRRERRLEGHEGMVTGVAWNPDGTRLATTSTDRTGRIWDAGTGESVAVLSGGHASEVRCVAWRPDGQVISTGGFDRTVQQWSPEGRRFTGSPELEGRVISLTYSADSRLLLATTGGISGATPVALLFNIAEKGLRVRVEHVNTVQAGAISPDGRLAATADSASNIHVWRTEGGETVLQLAGRGRPMFSVGWSEDGQTIAWGTSSPPGGEVNRYGPLERTFRLAELGFGSAPDGSFSEARPDLGGVRLRRLEERTAIEVVNNGIATATFRTPGVQEFAHCYSVLGAGRAVAGTEYGLYLFGTENGERQRSFQGHGGVVTAVAPSPDGRYLASCSFDQTVRIWDPGRGEPVLSVFPAGDDWIAWTPEGYYACSPGGERLIGWRVGGGPEAMGRLYPAADFHSRFYRPDVIRVLLRAGSVARALELLGDRSAVASVGESLPPEVWITGPLGSPARVAGPEVEVRAEARGRGGRAVKALRLLVDGRPYQGEGGRRSITREEEKVEPGAAARASWTLSLTVGRHRLAARAEGEGSASTSDVVEVEVGGDAGGPGVAKPRLYVLAVGIDAYPGPLALGYCGKDAEALAEQLQRGSRELYAGVEVRLLRDQEATRRGIVSGLGWLKSVMTDRDLALVFFSGHGQLDEDGTFYLIPVDVDVADLAGTAVHGSQFKSTLAGLRGRVMVLLDACHAGAGARGTGPPVGRSTDDLARDLASEEYGVVIMCSSTGAEVSLESAEVGHGYFTAALVEGLSGRADALPKDGMVYSTELDAYVENRVRELSGDRQHPVTAKPASVRPFALTRP